jgi:cytosine/adenosine deaminase-related metal-dependent hydrolase
LSQYDKIVLEHSATHGGFFNAHAHLDRAYTLSDIYLEHAGTTPLKASNLPLSVKQNLVGDLHTGPAYKAEDLRKRMTMALERQLAFGVRRIDTNIDATPDLPDGGLLAINIALELKKKFKKKGLDVRIAPTPIFGFKEKERWNVFKKAARFSDYLSLLPEKDDYAVGSDPDGKVGFKHHVRMGLELACTMRKEIQFHVDQMNVPFEEGAVRVLDVLEVIRQPILGDEPSVWLVHMISPSAYNEVQFRKLVERLLEHNVGVIVCPTAAISMRQLRSIEGPAHNSIARMAELIKAKVPIRIGTDNISDVFVPQADGDMLTEIKLGDLAVRINLPHIWAKLACGVALNNVDIHDVGSMLHEDRKACVKVNPHWQPAFD